ncbi:MAG: sigma-54-dependent transcriptional regulator [bacterium]
MANDSLRVLIIDDERTLSMALRLALTDDGFAVDEAATGAEGLGKLATFLPDVVLLDLRLPDTDGVEVLKTIREKKCKCAVIMMTAHGSDEIGFDVGRLGASDYIRKPFGFELIRLKIQNALENDRLRRDAETALVIRLGDRESDRFLLGRNAKMEAVYDLIMKVAESKTSTVLIQGECGTGKELVAKAIHHASFGRSLPFMVVNCGALPANLLESELFGHEAGAFTDAKTRKLGLMEVAQNGTLFLDEISEMPLPLQATLLRAIETKTFKRIGGVVDITVKVRVVAATNRDLRREVARGHFRQDLFYRLNVVPVVLPPLRERREDVLLLASHFIQLFNKELNKNIRGFSPTARTRLLEYEWPGNVRELRNVIERAIIVESDDEILLAHLPLEIAGGGFDATLMDELPTGTAAFVPTPLAVAEERHIRATMEWTRGNKTRAAQILKISRQTLRDKLRSYAMADQADQDDFGVGAND